MSLSLITNLNKLPETSSSTKKVEQQATESSEFSEVFDESPPKSEETDTLSNDVETSETIASEVPEPDNSDPNEGEDSSYILRADAPNQDPSGVLVPSQVQRTTPTAHEDNPQALQILGDDAETSHPEELPSDSVHKSTVSRGEAAASQRTEVGKTPDDNFKPLKLNTEIETPNNTFEQVDTNLENDLKTAEPPKDRLSDPAKPHTITPNRKEVRSESEGTAFKFAEVPENTARPLTGSPVKQTVAEQTSQPNKVSKGEELNNVSSNRTTIEVRTLVDSDDKTEQPAPKHAASMPMTMLERHLGGHPVTLVSQGPLERKPNVSIHDVVGSKELAKQTPDIPSQSVAVEQSIAPTRAQVVQTAGLNFAVIGQRQLGSEIDTSIGRVGEEAVWDLRSQPQVSSSIQAVNIPKIDVAGSVLQQITDAIRRSPDKPIEIALNPAELGRVRMVMSASDAGITVNILAERPDTMDLLRRNIDDLSKSFSEMGYEDISFSFEHGDQTADDSEPQHSDSPTFAPDEFAAPETENLSPKTIPALAIAPDGIDMRL